MAQAKIDNTPIVDLVGTQETFVTELAAIENLGPCYRLTFTVTQSGHDGNTERVAACRVIMSAEATQQMLADLPMLMRNLPDSRPNHENRAHLN